MLDNLAKSISGWTSWRRKRPRDTPDALAESQRDEEPIARISGTDKLEGKGPKENRREHDPRATDPQDDAPREADPQEEDPTEDDPSEDDPPKDAPSEEDPQQEDSPGDDPSKEAQLAGLAALEATRLVNALTRSISFDPIERQQLLEANSILARFEIMKDLLYFRLAESRSMAARPGSLPN